MIAAAESSVELMSDTQLEGELTSTGFDEALNSEILSIYSVARTRAYQAGMSFLVFVSMIGLVMAIGLQKRKLVES